METEAPATPRERAREAEKEDAAKRAAALREDKAKADEPQIEDDGGAAAAAATATHRAAEAAWDAKEARVRRPAGPRGLGLPREGQAHGRRRLRERDAGGLVRGGQEAGRARAQDVGRRAPAPRRHEGRRDDRAHGGGRRRRERRGLEVSPGLKHRLLLPYIVVVERHEERVAAVLANRPAAHVVADPAVAFLDGRHDGAVVELLDDVVQAEGVVRLGVDVEVPAARLRRFLAPSSSAGS